MEAERKDLIRRDARPDTKFIQFLRAFDAHQLSVQPEDALLQRARVIRNLARFRGRFAARLALNHDIEVDELLVQPARIVREAEGILARLVRGEHVVALALLLAVQDLLVAGVGDGEVDVKRPARLHGKVELQHERSESGCAGRKTARTYTNLLSGLVDVGEETEPLVARDGSGQR